MNTVKFQEITVLKALILKQDKLIREQEDLIKTLKELAIVRGK